MNNSMYSMLYRSLLRILSFLNSQNSSPSAAGAGRTSAARSGGGQERCISEAAIASGLGLMHQSYAPPPAQLGEVERAQRDREGAKSVVSAKRPSRQVYVLCTNHTLLPHRSWGGRASVARSGGGQERCISEAAVASGFKSYAPISRPSPGWRRPLPLSRAGSRA